MKQSTRQWVRKAEGDWLSALDLAKSKLPHNDQICFHHQQSSEKYLKAYMQELGLPVPKIHDLDELLKRLLPLDPSLKQLSRGLSSLTVFAVVYRYPGWIAGKRQAQSARRKAERIRNEIRLRLGLPT